MNTCMAAGRKQVSVLTALTSLGVFAAALSAGTNEWTAIGPFGGWVRTVAVDPKNSGTVYAGTPYGGLFKSTDGGKSWIAANTGLTRPYPNVLAFDPVDRAVVYVGTDYGGVFRSTDGGATWAALNGGLPNYIRVTALVIDPHDDHTLYAAIRAGIFKSTDSGANWTLVLDAQTVGTVNVLAIDPQNTGTLYAGACSGIWRTTDAGLTWNNLNPSFDFLEYYFVIAIDPKTPSTVYAGVNDVADNGIAGRQGLYKSTDGGNHWVKVLQDSTLFAIDPGNPKTLYALSQGAVFKTTNGGTDWTKVAALPEAAAFAMAIDALDNGAIYVATQSNGVVKSGDGGSTWNVVNVGLRAQGVNLMAVDPRNPGTLYTASVDHLFKTADDGKSWNILPELGWIGSLTIMPQDSSILFAGTIGDPDFDVPGAVFKSTDGGMDWNRLVSAATTAPNSLSNPERLSANAFAFDTLNSDTVYAAIGDVNLGYGQSGLHGGVLKSTDAGTTWTLADSGMPPDTSVRFLAIDPQNTGTVYAATGNDLAFVPGAGWGVFKSVNGGASWYPASTGLPPQHYDSGVVALVVDPMTPAAVYAAETAGIFKSTDGAMTWQPDSSGLPPTGISALAIDPRDSATLYAGTLDGVFTTADGGQSWVALDYPGLQLNPPNGTSPGVQQLLFDPQNPSTLYAVAGGAVFEITVIPASRPPVLRRFPKPLRRLQGPSPRQHG